jgi:perosamine synthetase
MIRLSYPVISDDAFQHVAGILQSGYLIQGEVVREFEDQLARYLGVEHVIAVSSGTAALFLSLSALGLKAGDEVIVPAFTFPAVANAVELTGATAVFADIKPEGYCIDTDSIHKLVSPRTKVILPVHQFGEVADMGAILDLAAHHGIPIVEDAACATGAGWQGKKAGTIGTMGCLSFHPRKMLTTGEGGAILTNDAGLASSLRSLRNHGLTHGAGRMDIEKPGLNFRMTDFQAAIGISQLSELDLSINSLNQQAASYNRSFANTLFGLPVLSDGTRFNVSQTYHLLMQSGQQRDAAIGFLGTHGIEANFGAYAIPALKYYRDRYKLGETHFPNAFRAFHQGLALPAGRHLNEENLEFIAHTLKRFLYDEVQ